jgi:hypothetical protein
MSTVFTFAGKMGDAILQFPVVHHYIDQTHDENVELWMDENTCKPLVPLFEAQPGIKVVKLISGVENWNCGGQPFHMNLKTSEFAGNTIYHLGLRGFPVRQISLQCLNDCKVPISVSPEVFAEMPYLSVDDSSPANRLVIHGKSVYPHNRSTPTMWRFLSSILQDVHELFEEVVFVGSPEDREVGLSSYPNWTAFDDGGDFLKLARLVAGSRCMIGVGSAPITLAGALKVPSVRVHDTIGDGSGSPRVIWDNLGANQLNRTEIELRKDWPIFRDRWLKTVLAPSGTAT